MCALQQEGAYRATRHNRYAVGGLSLEERKGCETAERRVLIWLIPSNIYLFSLGHLILDLRLI